MTRRRPDMHPFFWGLLLTLLLAACSSSGKKPEPQALPPDPGRLALREVWRSQLPAPLAPATGIRVQGERLLLASRDDTLTTLDARSGARQAHIAVQSGISASVGSDGQRTAVPTRDNQIVMYGPDGQTLWQQPLTATAYTAPLLAGGRVFVLSADRSLAAFDAANGQPLWSTRHTEDPLVLRQGGVLLAVGNTLLAGLGARLAAVDPDNGALLWQVPLASPRGTNDIERLADLVGPASRLGPHVCARAFLATVGCVDARSARLVWSQASRGEGGIAADAGAVFAVEHDGTVHAWQRRDGLRLWSATQLQHRPLSAPLLWDEALVLGETAGEGSGLLHVLSKLDGTLLTRLSTDASGVAAAPALVADTLVVVSGKGTVYGFRRDAHP